MKKLFCLLFLLFSCNLYAEPAVIALEKAPVNIHDIESIKRGAHTFATICMACHTMEYLRYDKLAKENGVIYEKMPLNVKQWPNGIKPPDLSLEVDYRGADWIYTYLHSFYKDTTRPTGFNNLLVPNTSMVGILSPFQGQLEYTKNLDKAKKIVDANYQWYDVLVLQQQGTLTPAQYDAMVADVVNFLNYAAHPYETQQRLIGYWVIGFLIILFILLYWLKHEYWKDVEKHKKDK